MSLFFSRGLYNDDDGGTKWLRHFLPSPATLHSNLQPSADFVAASFLHVLQRFLNDVLFIIWSWARKFWLVSS